MNGKIIKLRNIRESQRKLSELINLDNLSKLFKEQIKIELEKLEEELSLEI